MFLNRNLNQRMPKNSLKEIANKHRELLWETIAPLPKLIRYSTP